MASQKTIDKLFAAVAAKYGGESVTTLGRSMSGYLGPVIPTGIEALDRYVLGCGGLPTGRVSEVFGAESAGKSSLVASCIAGAQKIGGAGILIDAEKAFTAERATVFGANAEEVILLDPPHLEGGGDMLVTLLDALPDGGPPTFIALDSVPALITKRELKGDPSDVTMGVRAQFYSKLCTYLVGRLAKKNVHMMFVNQIRMKIGVVFGNPETTPGGNAIKFYATHRLRMSRAGKVEDGAMVTKIRAVKNKVAEPQREMEVRLVFKTGWNDAWSTLNHAKDLGVVPAQLKASKEGLEQARVALGWAKAEDAVEAPAKPSKRKAKE
jgi:recombination protein RecA